VDGTRPPLTSEETLNGLKNGISLWMKTLKILGPLNALLMIGSATFYLQ
jgi:hypothetical protein